MIYDEIVAERDNARVKADTRKVGVLNTIIGECQRKDRTLVDGRYVTPDAACISTLKKLRESVIMVRDLTDNDTAKQNLDMEIKILEKFIPVGLNDQEILEIAQKHVDLKSFMSYMKNTHFGKYDGRVASEIFKNKG